MSGYNVFWGICWICSSGYFLCCIDLYMLPVSVKCHITYWSKKTGCVSAGNRYFPGPTDTCRYTPLQIQIRYKYLWFTADTTDTYTYLSSRGLEAQPPRNFWVLGTWVWPKFEQQLCNAMLAMSKYKYRYKYSQCQQIQIRYRYPQNWCIRIQITDHKFELNAGYHLLIATFPHGARGL